MSCVSFLSGKSAERHRSNPFFYEALARLQWAAGPRKFMKIRSLLSLSLALAAPALAVSNAKSAPTPVTPRYHLAADWKLAGDGFWDYLTVDAAAHRLYIPRDTRIQVVDTSNGHIIGEIVGLKEAHGVALVPTLGVGFATSGGTNQVIVFKIKTLKPIGAPIGVGEGPDAIAYEPTTGQIFTMNGDGKSTSVINARTRRVVGTIDLGTNAESAVADGRGHLFINLEGTSQIAEINAKTRKIAHVWPLAPGEEPTGLSYDAVTQHLFAGCHNKTLVVLDARTGKTVAHLPIGAGVDAGVFDAKMGVSLSSCGRDGNLAIVGEQAGKPALLGTIPTHTGARTMALDPISHAVFVVAADYQPLQPGQRYPQAVPGTTRILKYEISAK